MRKLLGLLLMLAACSVTARAQYETNTARHIAYGATTPATCNPGTGDVFIVFAASTATPYYCQTTNTWAVWTGGSSPISGATANDVVCAATATTIKSCSNASRISYDGSTLLILPNAAPNPLTINDTIGNISFSVSSGQFTNPVVNIGTDAILQMTTSTATPNLVDNPGTSQSQFNSWAARQWEIAFGTAGAPVTGAGPTVKISRTEQVASATCTSNPVDNECNSGLSVYSTGTATDGMQVNAISALATGASTTQGDAVGLTAIGRVINSGIAIGTGIFSMGRRDTTTGRALGIEARTDNITAGNGTYNNAGISDTQSVWASCFATTATRCGAGVSIGSADGGTSQFITGFAVTAGSTATTSFDDHSSSTTSLNLAGTHTTALVVGASAGVVDFSAIPPTTGLRLPSAAGAVPTADGYDAVNTTTHAHVWGSNGTTLVGAVAATGTGTATTCSNQFVSAVSAIAVPTCATVALNTATSGILTGANGGTGVANTGFTITLAGNLITTGAFNTTFAQGATTTVTLPTTSSTLARTDAGQTFTGTQVFSSPILGTSGGTGVNNGAFTITLAGNLVTTGAFNTTFAAGGTATMTLPTTSQTIPGMNQTNTAGSSFVLDASAASVTAGLKIPAGAGAAPTADDFIAFNTTNHTHVWGSNGTTMVGAIAATGTGTVTTCTITVGAFQSVTAVSSLAIPTCTGITNASLNYSVSTALTSATGAIVNSETQIVGLSIGANTMAAGTTFHLHAGCNTTTSTSPGSVTFRTRIGTSSLSGNIAATVAAASNASVTTQPFTVDSWVTVRTNGAGGTVLGDISVKDDGAIATSAFANDIGSVTTATVAVDTTATKILELTAITGASTASITCQVAAISLVKI